MNDELTLQRRRQARLRPEAADLYPNIPPDVWLPADSVAERLWVLDRARRGIEGTWPRPQPGPL
jgi:hypothetical protein